MNALALHQPPESSGIVRWTSATLIVVLVHVGLIVAALAWYAKAPPSGIVDVPAIRVDFAPPSAAPELQKDDVAPGPDMQEAEPPAAEPPPAAEEPKVEQPAEAIAPTPPQPAPEVVAPPEPEPQPEPVLEKPELKPTVKPDPTPPKVVRKPEPKRARTPPSKKPPAPRTTAAPRADRVGPRLNSVANAAAAAAASASYGARLAAHLQRYKQYPSGSRAAREQGTARLSFTVSRSGAVLSARLSGSSGYSALDAETLALVRRAQPLPPFPPEMTQASMSFTVPIRYSMH